MMGADLLNELAREASYADTMQEAARYWMDRALRSEREAATTLAAVVHSAGGKVSVSRLTLMEVPSLVLTKEHYVDNDSIVFTAKPIQEA